MRVSFRHALLLVCVSGLLEGIDAAAIEPTPPPSKPGESPWDPWFQLGLIGSNDLNRAEGELFLPNGNDTTLAFLDIRGNFFTEDFDDKEIEGNMAMGLRHMLEQGWNIGLWVSGDVREVESDNTFWQVSTGIEALSDNFDFRFNGYAPVTGPKRAPNGSAKVKLSGNNIFMTGGSEVPLFGYDGEVGGRIPLDKIGLDRDKFELRMYAGGYHYFDDDAKDSIAGPSTRLQGTVFDIIPSVPGSRLIAHAEFNWDHVRGEHYEGGLLLRIPLVWQDAAAAKPLSARSRQARRMLEPIVRDVDVIVSESGKEKVEDALTDVRFDRVAWAEPAEGITAASADAGANSLLIANGDFDGTQELMGYQTLQGGGSSIAVRGVDSGWVAYFTAPGSAASITHMDVDPVLELLGTRAHVAGFTITGAGEKETMNNHGIFTEVPGFFGAFTYLTIQNTAENGIFLSGLDATPGDTTGIFEHVTVVNANMHGILIDGGDANSDGTRMGSFYDVDVSFTGEAGIRLSGGGDGDRIGSFENVTVSNTGSTGIEISGGGNGNRTGSFENVTVSDTLGIGIWIAGGGQGNRMGSFENVMVSNTGSTGIEISGGGIGDRMGSFENVTVSNTGSAGVEIGGGGDGLRSGTFDGVHISDTGGHGIDFSSSEGTVEAEFDDTTFAAMIGDGDDALINTENATTSFDGNVTNDATNSPDLCQGTFTGTVEFEGTDAMTVTDGVGCAP